MKNPLLNWMRKRRGPTDYVQRQPEVPDVQPKPIISGKYLLLYEHLQNRYADRVVLTFGQIESLLGFALPDQARRNKQWWTNAAVTAAEPSYSDSWVLARRVATPNLQAETVAFERA
jgi:hypothetical protein